MSQSHSQRPNSSNGISFPGHLSDEQKLSLLLAQYQELKADVRNYDNLLWQLPLISIGLFTVAASLTDITKLNLEILAVIATVLCFSSFTIWYFVTRQETYRQYTLSRANEIEKLSGSQSPGYPMPNELSKSVTWWKRASSVSVVKLLFFMIFLASFIVSFVISFQSSNLLLIIVLILAYLLFFGVYLLLVVRRK